MASSPPSKKQRSDVDDDLIVLRVENLTEMGKQSIESAVHWIGGFPWTLRAWVHEVDGMPPRLAVFLHSEMAAESNVWLCEVAVQFMLLNDCSSRVIYKEFDCVISDASKRHSCGTKNFVDFERVIKPSKGFIKDDAITIEARVDVKTRNQFRKKAAFDLRTPSQISKTAIQLDEEKIYVCKELLAVHSSYFHALFHGDFKEAKDESEIVLRDVDAKEFEVLLKLLYRTGEKINLNNIEFIVKLADRFDMKGILDEAELFLIDSLHCSLEFKLFIADQYNLFALMTHCISEVDSCETVREMQSTREYARLADQTKVILLEKFVQLSRN